jgi:uncharacterized SAM-binding protein YcdF (DUF218 family)
VKLSSIDPKRLSREETTRLAFGEPTESLASGDCIFVFGGRGLERVACGVQLLHEKRAPILLFSGGTKYGRLDTPEAETMRLHALAMGAPSDALLTETLSNNTKENVLASALVLDRAIGLHAIRRLLVVSIPWHMRRCLLTLQTYLPDWIQYSWIPAPYRDHQRNNWWTHDLARGYVIEECEALVRYTREGQLLDVDIEL